MQNGRRGKLAMYQGIEIATRTGYDPEMGGWGTAMASDRELTALTRETTNYKVLLTALLTALSGFVLNYIASLYFNDFWKLGGSALGTTLISIGIISIIFEVLLRRELQRELLRMVGIQGALQANQLVGAGQNADIAWKDVLSERGSFRILILDPEAWVADNFHIILSSARTKSVSVEFLFPDPDGEYITHMSSIVNKEVDLVKRSINQATAEIERKWTEAKSGGKLLNKSKVSIKFVADLPRYSIFIVDGRIISLMHTAVDHISKERNLFVEFFGGMQSYPSNWFLEQLQKCRTIGTRFENEVE